MPLYDARSDGFCGQGAFLPDARRQVKPGAGFLLISLGFSARGAGLPVAVAVSWRGRRGGRWRRWAGGGRSG